MTTWTRLALTAALLLPVGILACGDDDGHDHAANRPTCDQIGELCHPFDTGSGAAHDCHENAHDTFTEAQCQEALPACQLACSAVDAGAGGPDATATVPDAAP